MKEPTEVVKYVLMPTQKPRTTAAEAIFLSENYTKEVHSALKSGVYGKVDRQEMINNSISLSVQVLLKLRAPTTTTMNCCRPS